MWLKVYRYRLGINIPSFDGAEDVLVVKFANKQDDKQWDVVTFENLEVFEDIKKKMQRISARKST